MVSASGRFNPQKGQAPNQMGPTSLSIKQKQSYRVQRTKYLYKPVHVYHLPDLHICMYIYKDYSHPLYTDPASLCDSTSGSATYQPLALVREMTIKYTHKSWHIYRCSLHHQHMEGGGISCCWRQHCCLYKLICCLPQLLKALNHLEVPTAVFTHGPVAAPHT